jgi:very-short-patch-repair endonuclease
MMQKQVMERASQSRWNGFKFVRQFPIGRYFADFACRDGNLVVELDDSQHADSADDRRRDDFRNTQGWSVARFANAGAIVEMGSVLDTIVAILDGRLTEPTEAFDLRFAPTRRKRMP